jgi:hypothetical protein
MKPGDLVKRHRSLASHNTLAIIEAHEDVLNFNKLINFIWAFSTNRRLKPPISSISMPRHQPGVLIDNACHDFSIWIRQSNVQNTDSALCTPLVKVMWEGEIVVTFARWIEKVEKNSYFFRGEL